MTNNELMHYGVLGMKWGVRKDDRSSSSGSSKSLKKKATATATKLKKTVTKTKTENKRRDAADRDSSRRHTMSDKDLKQKIERIQNEKKLKDLTNQEYHPAKTFVTDVLKTSGKTIAVAAVVTGGALLAKHISNKTNNEYVKKWMTDIDKRLNKKK